MKKNVWRSNPWLVFPVLSLFPMVGACGVDLGDCQEYENFPEEPYPGQIAVQNNCVTCHSFGRAGAQRAGAPAGLNFDVPTVATGQRDRDLFEWGWAKVREFRKDMYAAAEAGTMPPSGNLSTSDLEDMRNWLACDAPAVPPQEVSGDLQGFDAVHARLNNACNQCHSEGAAPSAGQNFVFGTDKCAAYDNLVGMPGINGDCQQYQYVVPGNPEQSLLLSKLTGTPLCGAPMPLGISPDNAYEISEPETFEAVRAWIADGAPKPADCP